jgi:hypothetical protein
MATITVQIGQKNLAIDPGQFNILDLAQASTDLPFVLGGELTAFLDQTLQSMPAGSVTSLTLNSGNPSWNLGDLPGKIPVTFSLNAGASATVTVQRGGSLFSYAAEFDGTNKTDVPGKSGAIYLITEFSFHVNGTLSGNAPVGAIGVSVNAGGQAKNIVRNYKAFPPDTKLQDALQLALAGFTLPFHGQTINQLGDGDAIYYTFDGSVNVGFGATYGWKTAIGGYNLSDISSGFATAAKVVDVSTKGVTVAANAGLALKFNWSRSFECFLERSKPDAGAGSAMLHLSAGKSSSRSVGLSADGGIQSISAPQITANAASVSNLIIGKLGGNSPAIQAAVQPVVATAQIEIQKYLADANNWLNSLTQKVQSHGSIALAAAFEGSSQFTSAFTWNFDLANANFAGAWQDAIGGDFVKALATGAATLASGSGYESLHSSNTKVSLALFGLAQFVSMDSYFAKSTLRYASGQFFMETSAGKVHTSSSKSRSSSASIYLDGTATSVAGAGPLGNLKIQFHGILSTKGDKTQFAKMGRLAKGLGVAFNGMPAGAQLIAIGDTLTSMSEAAKPGAAVLHAIYDLSALQTLEADAYVNGKQSAPPHLLDAANWVSYAAASDQIPSDPASFLAIWQPSSPFYKKYGNWAAFNALANGFIDTSTGEPLPRTDRRQAGNPTPSVLRGFFGNTLKDLTCQQLTFYWEAGQQFMNLCDDLRAVISQVGGKSLDWDSLTSQLERIAGDDLDSWFSPVIILAMAGSIRATSVVVQENTVSPADASSTAVVAIS